MITRYLALATADPSETIIMPNYLWKKDGCMGERTAVWVDSCSTNNWTYLLYSVNARANSYPMLYVLVHILSHSFIQLFAQMSAHDCSLIRMSISMVIHAVSCS